MIEKIVLDYLTPRLSVPVLPEVPERPPERFVIVEKTGGGIEEGLHTATLIVQSCAPQLLDALQLNEKAKAAMLELDALPDVCRVSLNNDYRFTDPTLKRRRYQAVFDIVYYGEYGN